jgi:hypothetical protein
MNILKGIISGVKAVFGANQDGASNVMRVATGVGNWIDEQQFTPEEKAKYSAETAQQFQAFMDSTIKENTQRSITRRSLAIWVIRTWIMLLFASIIAQLFGMTGAAEYIWKVATYSTFDYLVLGVGGFFFGAHIIRQTKLADPKA